MGDLSPNFSRVEFACPGAIHVPCDVGLIGRLQLLRSKGGRPLEIVSGYRTAQHNAAIGGAANSLHLWGMAADIPAGYAVLADAVAAGFTGIGMSGPWVVHVDVREGVRQIFVDSPH